MTRQNRKFEWQHWQKRRQPPLQSTSVDAHARTIASSTLRRCRLTIRPQGPIQTLAHEATRYARSVALVAARCTSPCDVGIVLLWAWQLAGDRLGTVDVSASTVEGRQRVVRPTAVHGRAIVAGRQRLLHGRTACLKVSA